MARIHDAVGRSAFHQATASALLETQVIPTTHVQVAMIDVAARKLTLDDQDGPVLMYGRPGGDYLLDHAYRHPLNPLTQADATETGPLAVSQVISTTALRRTLFYSDLNKVYGSRDVLTVGNEQRSLFLAFLRDRNFSDADRAAAALLKAHFNAACRSHCLLQRARQAERLLAEAGTNVWVVPLRADGSLTDLPPDLRQRLAAAPGEGAAAFMGAGHALRHWLRLQIRCYPWPADDNPVIVTDAAGQSAGRLYFMGSLDGAHRVAFVLRPPNAGPPPRYRLTPRETEVLRWVCAGKSNAEIAVILGSSRFTVRNQIESLLRKLMVENRTAAAVMARGWFDPLLVSQVDAPR